MSLLRRLVWIFVSPTKVFDEIRERKVNWVQPWIIASVFYLLAGVIGMPIQLAVMELNPNDLPADQLEQQIEMAEKFSFVGYIMAPAMVLIITLIMAGLTYIMVTILSKAATFKQYFTLMMFVNVIGALGYLLSMAVVRMRGAENIMDPEDARFALSLRMLATESGAVLKGLLGSIDFFVVWSFILLVLGLKRVFGMTTGAAVACMIPAWLLYATLSIVGEFFGGMAGG
jgi:hypothetical protein